MKNFFKFICCGNVDDGKSTLIGRILLDTNNVKKDQFNDALAASKQNGSDKIELSMLLDGLIAEREQQITIDIAHRFFDYQDTRFHILDCPGHKQYTKNMAIATAEADTAIVVVDITKGIKDQTLTHIEICSLFHIKNILVCLTKVDLISQNDKTGLEKINQLKNEIEQILAKYHFDYQIIPVSAVTGYNIDKVLSFLVKTAQNKHLETKNNQQNILHILSSKVFQGKRYYYAKSLLKNKISDKDVFTVYPQNNQITISKIYENGAFNISQDVDIFVGDCLSNVPVHISNTIYHKTIWFETPSKTMLFRHGSITTKVVNISEQKLELDKEIVFNNINEVKENGFGIFIDEITKKTLGCAVFIKNSKDTQTPPVYVIIAKNHTQCVAEAESLKNLYSIPPLILDEKELKEKLGIETHSLLLLAQHLNNQGFCVICLLNKEIPVPANFTVINLTK